MKGLLFTYIATYGGSVAALFNPFIGLLIYICFAIIKPDMLWHWSVPQGNYSRIIAISLLMGWVLQGFGSWRFGRATVIVTALVGYWSWAVLSNLGGASHPAVGWEFVEAKAKIILPFLASRRLKRSAN